jgi:hypothetical protein
MTPAGMFLAAPMNDLASSPGTMRRGNATKL